MILWVFVFAAVFAALLFVLVRLVIRGGQRFAEVEGVVNPQLTEIQTESERKVRRNWLISFALYYVSVVVAYTSLFLEEGIFDEVIREFGFFWALGASAAISALILACGLSIVYYCAFRRKGTALLLLILCAVPTRELLGMAKAGIEPLAQLDPVGWLIFAALLGVEVFYWFCSLRLYQVNRLRKNLYKTLQLPL